MIGISVQKHFWDDFLANHWGKVPMVLDNPFGGPLATQDEVFQVFADVSDEVRRGKELPLSISIDGGQLVADFDDLLPQKEDGSMGGYAARIHGRLPNRHFMFNVADGLQRYNADIWERARDILAGLVERIGIPPGGTKIDAFTGGYSRTPTGIHIDSSDNFSFVVQGKKKMAFWPFERFRSRLDPATYPMHEDIGTREYEKHLDGAIILEAHEGQVFYWPRTYWHLAVADSLAWSTTANLAMWWHAPPGIALHYALGRAGIYYSGAEPRPYPLDGDHLQRAVQSIPAALTEELAAFRAKLASPLPEEAMKQMWVSVLTSGGLLHPPKPDPVRELADGDRIVVDPKHPILAVPAAGDQLLIAASGHVQRTPRRPELAQMIARLNTGSPVSVRTLIDETATAGGAERGDIRSLLEHFVSVRAARAIA
jgi:hypothetical protein